MNWTKVEVGCYWTAPNGFHIATRRFNWTSGVDDAYVLYNGFRELGLYKTLAEAQEAAEPNLEVPNER